MNIPEKISKKDFIEIAFTARIKDGKIFDSNIKEDIATFREAVVSNPGFFKRFRLLDSENNPYYFSAYKKKIDLLLKYGFITQAEYGAVFE